MSSWRAQRNLCHFCTLKLILFFSNRRISGYDVVQEPTYFLFSTGARVIMACRSVEKAEAAAKEIREATKDVPGAGTVHVVKLDLGSLTSVRQCAKELLQNESRINLLVNNAGIVADSRGRTMVHRHSLTKCYRCLKSFAPALAIQLPGKLLLC
jgi:NAD(P)-dependent dehydrogenase (short-subunit alcohol dehydrogenase family)